MLLFTKSILLIFLVEILNYGLSYMRCGQKEKTAPSYHMVRPCTSSKMGRLASANLLTINSCKIFARKNNGLAFSFSPEGIAPSDDYDEEESTCNVYECPEFGITMSQYPSAYHYYSLYAQPIPDINVTCVPGTGVFTVHLKKVNYTEARKICEENRGQLADVLSDQRTKMLTELLSRISESKKNIQAYVGLDDILSEGTYISSNGHLLECSTYQAWAPGEPHSKNDEDCVVINKRQTWQVVNCKNKLPFICEILPSGPHKLCSANNTLISKRECVLDHINRTEIMKENSKCHLPPSYEKEVSDLLIKIDNALNRTNNSTTGNEEI